MPSCFLFLRLSLVQTYFFCFLFKRHNRLRIPFFAVEVPDHFSTPRRCFSCFPHYHPWFPPTRPAEVPTTSDLDGRCGRASIHKSSSVLPSGPLLPFSMRPCAFNSSPCSFFCCGTLGIFRNICKSAGITASGDTGDEAFPLSPPSKSLPVSQRLSSLLPFPSGFRPGRDRRSNGFQSRPQSLLPFLRSPPLICVTSPGRKVINIRPAHCPQCPSPASVPVTPSLFH